MLVSRRIDQLRREADLIPGTEHGTFYHRIHVQLTSDLRQRLARSLIDHLRRCGRSPVMR
jgi:hypothetical protein